MEPKKCAVVHVRRRVETHTHDALGPRVDENICVSDLEEGNQYKFWGVLETAKKEVKMSLECAAKELFRRCLSSGQVPCLITTV